MFQSTKTTLVVTIDLEEDNWGQHRSGITCDNVREIPRLQELFNRYNIVPTYLVTYQVCLHDWAVAILLDIHRQGKCEIGTHLHPWNTPPETESLTPRNSMLPNLPYELQLAKLRVLTEKIERGFNIKPQSFRAGRWGVGPETVDALLECRYKVDTSVTPTISWKDDGDGPIYKDVLTEPYLLPTTGQAVDTSSSIIEIPATIGFNRWPFEFWNKIYTIAEKRWLKPLHPIGILNRTSILKKIWLSPEGMSSADMITLSGILIKHNRKILNLSFHSNTLLPGMTPFVKTSKEADVFYLRLEKFFEYLYSSTNLCSVTLSDAASKYPGQ